MTPQTRPSTAIGTSTVEPTVSGSEPAVATVDRHRGHPQRAADLLGDGVGQLGQGGLAGNEGRHPTQRRLLRGALRSRLVRHLRSIIAAAQGR